MSSPSPSQENSASAGGPSDGRGRLRRQSLSSLPFITELRKYSVGSLVVDALAGIGACALPLIQRHLIDFASARNASAAIQTAITMAVLAVIVFACTQACRWLRGILRVKAYAHLREMAFVHLISMPEEFIRSRGSRYFYNRVQLDVNEVLTFLCGNALAIWVKLLKLAIAVVIVGCLNPWIAALVAIIAIPQALLTRRCMGKQKKLSRELLECSTKQNQLLQEYIEHHTVIKTHGTCQSAEEKVVKDHAKWGSIFRARLKNETVFSCVIRVTAWLCHGIVLLAGLAMVIRGKITLGELWAYHILCGIIQEPVHSLAAFMLQWSSAGAAWSRFQELFAIPTEDSGGRVLTQYATGPIRLEKVSFQYTPEEPLLQELSLELPQRGVVIITGPNGCGKSTLLSLLLKLFRPQSGRITVGDTDLADISADSWRRRIGYLGQSPQFLQGTLRENLCYGCLQRPSDDEIMRLLERVGATRLVSTRQAGLDAEVVQDGQNFSGGERLRIALARELLRDTDILLLDEPAAHLDLEGKAQFLTMLSTLESNKCIVAVLHDLPVELQCPVIRMPARPCKA